MSLLRALRAESLKLRGTLALWMCLIAPALVVLMLVLQISIQARKPMEIDPQEAWLLLARSMSSLWAFLMLPLFITLESALLAALEHSNQQWKHLLALPLPRRQHFLAKLAALALLTALATLAMTLLIALGGGALMLIKPGFGLSGWPPLLQIAQPLATSLAAAMLMVSLHTIIALRWRSFTVAVAVGMSATVFGFLIGQSERFGHYYPWSLPLQSFAGSGQWTGFSVALGLAGGAVVAFLGMLDFIRRQDT